MKVTGYQLQAAIKGRQEMRDLLQGEFQRSLFKFEDEDKRSPSEIAEELDQAERDIAALQAAQGLYNTMVTVTIGGETVSLLQAVKQVGGANRLANLWKGVAGSDTGGRHRHYDMFGGPAVRDKDQEVAKAMVTSQEAIELTQAASQRARELRAAIQAGNSVEMSVNVDPALLSQ
jgi:hypothetical protein